MLVSYRLTGKITILACPCRDGGRCHDPMPAFFHDRHPIVLATASVPCLKENCTADFVDGVRHLAPCFGMIPSDEERGVLPVTAGPVDESTFIYDEACAIPRAVGVMCDLRLSRFIVVDTTVPRHSTHHYAVAQTELITNNNRIEETRHGRVELRWHG